MREQPDKWPDAVHEAGHAAAARSFGWPIRELSIQAVKGSDADRVGICRLGIDPFALDTHEDLLRSMIKIENIAKKIGGKIFYSHDPESFAEFTLAPNFYGEGGAS